MNLTKPEAALRSLDAALTRSPALRRELMNATIAEFDRHPRTTHPMFTFHGVRIRGNLTLFRYRAEVQYGGRWVILCARWH